MFFAKEGNLSQRPNRLCMVLMVATLLSPLPSNATAAESVLPAGPSLGAGNYLSVFLSLAVVIGLIMLVGWVMKRLQRVQRGGSVAMEVIDVLPVGPKEKILMVRAGQSRLLVGMTPGRLSTLGILDDEAASTEDRPEFRISDFAA